MVSPGGFKNSTFRQSQKRNERRFTKTMKTKTLAKRIASIVLAMTIVLSFALVSVSAIPADQAIDSGKQLAVNFDNQSTAGFTAASNLTIGVSNGTTEPAHSGNYSLKLNVTANYAKLKIDPAAIAGSSWGFDKNAKYYMSFWCYSDAAATGVGTGTNLSCPPYSGTVTSEATGTSTGQWHKRWFTIDTTGTGTQTYIQVVFTNFYSPLTGAVYIDDVEIAKVDGTSSASYTIPANMEAETTLSKTFEDSTSKGVSAMQSDATALVSADYAHWGEISFKLQNTNYSTNHLGDYGLYVNTSANNTFGATGLTPEAGASYYFSYYVYSPDKDIKIQTTTIENTYIAPTITVPQGVWKKVQGVFTATGAKNEHLIKIKAIAPEDNAVYFDDFVFAKLTETPSAEAVPMTISSASVADGATGVAPVKELYFKVPYAVKEDTVTADKFSINGNNATIAAVAKVADTEIKVTLDGVWYGETYTLSVDGVTNTAGGVLTDSITFTTKKSDVDVEYGFEGTTSLPSRIAPVKGTVEILSEKAHTGNQSMKLSGQNDGNKYGRVLLHNLDKSTKYKVSFWWYSDTWKGNMNITQGWTASAFPKANTTTTTGVWYYTESVVTSSATGNNNQLTFWTLDEGQSVYIDDLKIERLDATACQPTIKANGEYVKALADETSIEFTIAGSKTAKTVTAFVVTYGENNKMLSATPVTQTVAVDQDTTFTLTVTKTAGATTKVIVMDAETYAPLYDVIE